ncbi:hypothetical protein Tco_1385286 [Tanacetum coccineum]
MFPYGCFYPKMLWEPLPKDVGGGGGLYQRSCGILTQRCCGSLYPKMLWMPHGKWRVRRSGAQGCKAWIPSCIAWSGGQGWWSGGQDVGVVSKGVSWGKRVIMGRVHGCFWTANIGPVPGQMTHFVASLTLDSVKSCVMQGASCTQRKVSSVPFVFSIPFVLSWGGSISPDSFLSSILLLVVMVVIVVVTVILVVVVVIVGGVPSIIKLLFVIVVTVPSMLWGQPPDENFHNLGDLVGLLYSNRFTIGIPPGQGIFGESTSSKFHFAVLVGVSLGLGFLFILSIFAMLAACASRAAATLSATSYRMAA